MLWINTDLLTISFCWTVIFFFCYYTWQFLRQYIVQSWKSKLQFSRTIIFNPLRYLSIFYCIQFGSSALFSLFLLLILNSIVYTFIVFCFNFSWSILHWLFIFSLTIFAFILKNYFFNFLTSSNIDILIIFIGLVNCLWLIAATNNFCALLLLLDIQGLLLLLWIILMESTLIKKSIINKLNNLTLSRVISIQFWINFLGTFMLTLSIYLFFASTGITVWSELRIITLFTTTYTQFHSLIFTCATIFLLLSFLIKNSGFPFFFWKPLFFQFITFWTILPYIILITFTYTWLIIIIHNQSLLLILCFHFISWFIIIGNPTIFFAMFYILNFKALFGLLAALQFNFVLSAFFTKFALPLALFLLLIYVSIFLLFALFVIQFNVNFFNYLTDLYNAGQLEKFMIFLLIILATFAGLPPFIGFWPKILLVWQLNYAAEWLLLLVTISTSVFVMFYYFYNYRFFNNDAKFALLTFLQPKYTRISALFIALFLSNCNCIMFFNDLWNSLETICQLYEFYTII